MQQIQQMKLVRDRAPTIDENTLIQKAIPMDTVDAMMSATMDIVIKKSMTKDPEINILLGIHPHL